MNMAHRSRNLKSNSLTVTALTWIWPRPGQSIKAISVRSSMPLTTGMNTKSKVFIIAVGECGYSFDPATVHPDDFEVDIYHMDSMRDLAEHFVDEGLYGEIPKHLAYYIDYDAIAVICPSNIPRPQSPATTSSIAAGNGIRRRDNWRRLQFFPFDALNKYIIVIVKAGFS